MAGRSGAFLQYCARLYQTGDEPVRSSALWGEAETTPSTVHQWIRHLRFHRAITPTEGGYRVDRPRLLQLLTAHRMARIQPIHEGSIDLDARGFSELLRRQEINHVLCMLSAANEWAFFEPRAEIDVYIDRHDAPRVRSLVTNGRYRVNLYAENLQEILRRTRGDVAVTDLFLTILDCRAHPEGGAHAHFLEQMFLRRGEAEREATR